MTVNEMINKINEFEAQIWAIENEIKNNNAPVLIHEILDLESGVGEGYTEGDYYACTRYYSKIPGVKNIRIGENEETHTKIVYVKIYSPKGKLVPTAFEYKDTKYEVVFDYSSKYSEEIDY